MESVSFTCHTLMRVGPYSYVNRVAKIRVMVGFVLLIEGAALSLMDFLHLLSICE